MGYRQKTWCATEPIYGGCSDGDHRGGATIASVLFYVSGSKVRRSATRDQSEAAHGDALSATSQANEGCITSRAVFPLNVVSVKVQALLWRLHQWHLASSCPLLAFQAEREHSLQRRAVYSLA